MACWLIIPLLLCFLCVRVWVGVREGEHLCVCEYKWVAVCASCAKPMCADLNFYLTPFSMKRVFHVFFMNSNIWIGCGSDRCSNFCAFKKNMFAPLREKNAGLHEWREKFDTKWPSKHFLLLFWMNKIIHWYLTTLECMCRIHWPLLCRATDLLFVFAWVQVNCIL